MQTNFEKCYEPNSNCINCSSHHSYATVLPLRFILLRQIFLLFGIDKKLSTEESTAFTKCLLNVFHAKEFFRDGTFL